MTPRPHRVGDGLTLPGQRVGQVLTREARAGHTPVQVALTQGGLPLDELDLVVVDLETTGTGARAAITEIGAVRVRGGKIVDTLTSLVNPRQPIPPAITALTGITNAQVLHAPGIEEVAPRLADFLAGAWGLVAHNARFDIGFMRRAWREVGLEWGNWVVVDTLRLARLVLPRPHVANHRLSTLAAYFGANTTPTHRALDDALATVDILAGLMRLARPYGLTHADDLATLAKPVRRYRRANARLAEGLPTTPGVYRFLGADRQILYIGSATSLKTRVASYFTAGEQRNRILEMATIARAVTFRALPSVAWARIIELRELAATKPPYNRRSVHPERYWFVTLTTDAVPRLALTHAPSRDVPAAGPLPSRAAARLALEAIAAVTHIRTCTQRIDATPVGLTPCYRAEVGQCTAPCLDGTANEGAQHASTQARALLDGAVAGAVADLMGEVRARTRTLNFEAAADEARRVSALLTLARVQEACAPVRHASRLLIGHRAEAGGWCVSGIRYGRLVLRAWAPRTADVPALLTAVSDAWERGATWLDDAPALWEETRALAGLVTSPGTRIIAFSGEVPLACSREGGWSLPEVWEKIQSSRDRSLRHGVKG